MVPPGQSAALAHAWQVVVPPAMLSNTQPQPTAGSNGCSVPAGSSSGSPPTLWLTFIAHSGTNPAWITSVSTLRSGFGTTSGTISAAAGPGAPPGSGVSRWMVLHSG